jgi:hypothetical protein
LPLTWWIVAPSGNQRHAEALGDPFLPVSPAQWEWQPQGTRPGLLAARNPTCWRLNR